MRTAAARARLLFMDDLDGIEAHGDARWVEAGEYSGGEDDGERAGEHGDGPMELHGPSERLFVDDVDQNQRQRGSECEADGAGEEAEETGFEEDQAAELECGGTEETEQTQLAAAIDDESKQSAGDAQDGDDDGDGFEGIGDGEGAVEDADGLGAEGAVGERVDAEARTGRFDGTAAGFERDSGSEIDGEVGGSGVGQVAQQGGAVH